jgi:hypothetical protein
MAPTRISAESLGIGLRKDPLSVNTFVLPLLVKSVSSASLFPVISRKISQLQAMARRPNRPLSLCKLYKLL